MREISNAEIDRVSGGVAVIVVVETVLLAVAISDAITDFCAGYKAAMND